MITGSKELIRDMNTQLVLQTIMEEGPISRADVSKRLGLTKATVSAIVQDLLSRELVREIGTCTVPSGRKPILLEFASDCAYAVSIDVSPHQLTLLSSTLSGSHRAIRRYPTQNRRDCIMEELTCAISQQLVQIPDCRYHVIGITLGIHGIVDRDEVLFTSYSDYAGLPFVSTIHKTFQIPVHLVNEANLSAFGDYNAHYPGKNVVEISVHSGIGMGIILNKKLFFGTNGYAGEFGHTIVRADGRPCPCGNRGCLEQYASEQAVLSDYAREANLPSIHCDDFISLCREGDSVALLLLNRFIQYIAIAINNILNTLDPDLIILNSSFTAGLPHILKDIKAAVPGRHHKDYRLLASELQDMSVLLGGIFYARMRFLELDL